MAARARRKKLPDGTWVILLVDDLLRSVRITTDDGELIEERPFTEDENVALDHRLDELGRAATELALTADARVQLQAMRASIGPGDAPAGTDSLNAIINTPNATLNASPAPYIKALARLVRELTRATIRLGRLVTRDLTEPVE